MAVAFKLQFNRRFEASCVLGDVCIVCDHVPATSLSGNAIIDFSRSEIYGHVFRVVGVVDRIDKIRDRLCFYVQFQTRRV